LATLADLVVFFTWALASFLAGALAGVTLVVVVVVTFAAGVLVVIVLDLVVASAGLATRLSAPSEMIKAFISFLLIAGK
jgi:hypothetical protein